MAIRYDENGDAMDRGKRSRPDGAEKAILLSRVAAWRRRGWTQQKIALKLGVPRTELQQWIAEAAREALADDTDAGRELVDLSVERYEALIRKLYPVVMKGDVKKPDIQRVTKLLLDVMAAELKCVGGGRMGPDIDTASDDYEAEARKYGIKVDD